MNKVKKLKFLDKSIFVKVFVTFFIFIPLVETTFISLYISELYLLLIFIWMIGSLFFNFTYVTTLTMASYYLIFSLFFLYADQDFWANRMAIWFYLFLCFSFGVLFLEKLNFRAKNKELTTPFTALSFTWNTIIRSTYLYITLFCVILGIIYSQFINQAKYYYWFFSSHKFERYFFSTAIYQLIFFAVLAGAILRLSAFKKINRVSLVLFLLFFYLCNLLIYKLTTNQITVVGDQPIIAEIKENDEMIMLFGHNFRRWPNEYSSVHLNEKPQDVIFWSSELIVFWPSEKKEDRKDVWVKNSLELTSEKFQLDEE